MKKYLNDTEAKEELINYICSTKINYALLISGTWGCGKTFFVKEFIKELEQENKFSKINAIYISLYGLHDISEIKDKIVLCSIKNKKAQKIIPYLNIGLSTISDIVSGITNVKKADEKIKSIINQIYKIDNLVIFIDDIERCDIDINSILGYINELVEHNDVKAVLIADEEKIGRINFNRNVELKYILGFLNSSQFKKNVSDSNNQNTKTISKEELINNANEIFSEDIIYNEIKEKLIGRVISYKANIDLVYDKFVDEIIDNKSAKYTAINNKKSFLQQLEINNYHNLRTIQFILSSFNRLVNETLNLANLDDIKEIYLNDLFNYCIIKSIKLKQGIKSYNWDKNQNFGTVYLGNENEYIFKNFATGFKFVDDYLENAYLNKKYIKETLEEYKLNTMNEISNPSDPLYQLKNWWIISEKELDLILDKLFINIKNNDYHLDVYSKIISYLSHIEEMEISSNKIKNIILEMEKNIKNDCTSGKYYEDRIYDGNRTVSKIYEKNIKNIRKLIKEKEIKDTEKEINNIYNSPDWGTKLKLYCETNISNFLDKKSFAYILKKDLIIKNIKEKEIKEIYQFWYALQKIYNSTNIKEYYKNDKETLIILNKSLKELKKIDKVRKYVLSSIIKFIEEIIEILN